MINLKDLMENPIRSSPDGKHWEPCLPYYLGWRIRLRDAWAVWKGEAVAVRQTTKEDVNRKS
jgi:hypothetical protein